MEDNKIQGKAGAETWRKAGDISLEEFKERMDGLAKTAANVAVMDRAVKRPPPGPTRKEKAKQKRKRKAARKARRKNR